jgi:hypothetical protein
VVAWADGFARDLRHGARRAGVRRGDPHDGSGLALGGGTLLLLLVGLAAGYLPARRLARVDPRMQALRRT